MGEGKGYVSKYKKDTDKGNSTISNEIMKETSQSESPSVAVPDAENKRPEGRQRMDATRSPSRHTSTRSSSNSRSKRKRETPHARNTPSPKSEDEPLPHGTPSIFERPKAASCTPQPCKPEPKKPTHQEPEKKVKELTELYQPKKYKSEDIKEFAKQQSEPITEAHAQLEYVQRQIKDAEELLSQLRAQESQLKGEISGGSASSANAPRTTTPVSVDMLCVLPNGKEIWLNVQPDDDAEKIAQDISDEYSLSVANKRKIVDIIHEAQH